MSKVIRRSSKESANGNLVLSIKPGESLLIGSDISILVEIERLNRVKLVISAPKSTKVRRKAFEERNKVQDEGTGTPQGNP